MSYMLNKIKSGLIKRKLKVVKPFGVTKNNKAVSFTVCGFTEATAYALANEFSEFDQVEIVLGDILNADCDALVSPANSFGEMSGGLDKSIDNFYEGRAQNKAMKSIRREFMGELPVGSAFALNMETERFPFLILAPTMRIPGFSGNSINAYLAMRGVLVCLAKHNASGGAKIRSIAIPSLCTGVGGMNETESAKQMKTAFENVVMDKWLSIKHPAMAPYATR